MEQMQSSRSDRWALVLAGGEGMRLRALVEQVAGQPMPKQYCRLLGSRSLLEMTLDRVRRFAAPERTAVVITEHHRSLAAAQLGSLPPANVVAQPANRDTGPGILFPLLALAPRMGAATVALFPSDHFLADEDEFARHVEMAARLVERFPSRIALLGMVPDRPDPELGYVVPGARLRGAGAEALAFRVRSFAEKPERTEASRLIEQGALWNSFVLVFRLPTLLRLVRRIVPAHVNSLQRAMQLPSLCEAHDHSLPAWNFSRDFLARAVDSLMVLAVPDVGWTDCGTWESLLHAAPRLPALPQWFPQGASPGLVRA